MMKSLLCIASVLVALSVHAQPATTVTTSAVQTITGKKTFSGTSVLCLKEPSGTDVACLNAPALSSSTIAITLPATASTLATTAQLPSVMTGDLGSGGTSGLVPAPITGDAAKFLRGDATWASASTISGLTSGRVTLSVTSTTLTDDSGLTYDATNDRLMVGTAGTTANRDFYLRKTVNGLVSGIVQDDSTGTAGVATVGAFNSSGGTLLSKYSTGYTTSGLLAADVSQLNAETGPLLISTATANPIRFSVSGTGTEIAQFNASGLTTIGLTNSALTTGRVPFSSTAGLQTDDASLAYTVTGGLRLLHATAGEFALYVTNTSNSAAAYAVGAASFNDGGAYGALITRSSGWTTAGIVTANDSDIEAGTGNLLLMAVTSGKDIKLAAGGSAATNVGLTIKTGVAILHGYAITSLPTGTEGAIAYVTDQITACAATGIAPTAGGALRCPVFYNGSAWVGM